MTAALTIMRPGRIGDSHAQSAGATLDGRAGTGRFMNRQFLWLGVIAIALTGCGKRAEDENTLRIGAIVELTGDMPAVGASSRNAAELAVSELNAAGGINIGHGNPGATDFSQHPHAS